jgi:hypothetical protein
MPKDSIDSALLHDLAIGGGPGARNEHGTHAARMTDREVHPPIEQPATSSRPS